MKNIKIIASCIIALAMTACTASKDTENQTVFPEETISVTESSDDTFTTISEMASEESEKSLPDEEENMSAAGQADTDVISVSIQDVVEYALAEGDIDKEQVTESFTAFSLADLNSDGVDEVFLKYSYGAGLECYVTVYDVSDGIRKLTTLNSGRDDNILYRDKAGDMHYISRSNYFFGSNNYFIAYFDMSYTDDGANVNIPLCALPHTWYDNSEFKSEYSVYKDSGYDPDVVGYEYRFIISEDNFVGNYGLDEFDINGNSDNERVSELIQKYVFDGLTHIKDMEFTTVSEVEDVFDENKSKPDGSTSDEDIQPLTQKAMSGDDFYEIFNEIAHKYAAEVRAKNEENFGENYNAEEIIQNAERGASGLFTIRKIGYIELNDGTRYIIGGKADYSIVGWVAWDFYDLEGNHVGYFELAGWLGTTSYRDIYSDFNLDVFNVMISKNDNGKKVLWLERASEHGAGKSGDTQKREDQIDCRKYITDENGVFVFDETIRYKPGDIYDPESYHGVIDMITNVKFVYDFTSSPGIKGFFAVWDDDFVDTIDTTE